jgi:hypothetical protein
MPEVAGRPRADLHDEVGAKVREQEGLEGDAGGRQGAQG